MGMNSIHKLWRSQRQPRTVSGVIQWARRFFQTSSSPARRFLSSGFESIDPSHVVEEESLPYYESDGFYPVHIGEIFDDKYKVLGKLGYGASSTVWLSRDLQSHCYVALKVYIRTPPSYCGTNREIKAYEHLRKIRSYHPGQSCIRRVLDSFEIIRPDKTHHHCLVHPPLHMSLWKLQRMGHGSSGLSEDIVKGVLRQLFNAVDFLHTECNMTHCDIKAGNLMLTIEDESILSDFEKAEIEDPSPWKVVDTGRTIYRSRNLRNPKNDAWGRPVLCDFGEARIGGEHVYEGIQPAIYKAPEIVMESTWSYSVDIWNIGCMLWDIFENKNLFDAHDEDGEHSGRRHVAEMIAYIGLPPLEFQERCVRAPLIFDENGDWKDDTKIPSISLEQSEWRLKGEEKEQFLGFIRSMLRWLPEERKTAKELLNDPWLSG